MNLSRPLLKVIVVLYWFNMSLESKIHSPLETIVVWKILKNKYGHYTKNNCIKIIATIMHCLYMLYFQIKARVFIALPALWTALCKQVIPCIVYPPLKSTNISGAFI